MYIEYCGQMVFWLNGKIYESRFMWKLRPAREVNRFQKWETWKQVEKTVSGILVRPKEEVKKKKKLTKWTCVTAFICLLLSVHVGVRY